MSGNFNYCPTHGINHCHGHHHLHLPHPHTHFYEPTWLKVTKIGIVAAVVVCAATGVAPAAAIGAGIAGVLGAGKQ
ncbi:hypothetical protein ACE1CI_18555 [Aerosakkonemataceae cyanobacterium BLCC-F50]|uniref:Transmembrane protein n=1 Tax=Floridaenema flaviceps BLCC-F50 TaxID=3153642 RepID=A0ABV4XT85_9CYAN